QLHVVFSVDQGGDPFTEKRMVIHGKNSDQARVNAHDVGSFETVCIWSAPASWRRRRTPRRPAELLFRLPFRSRHPVSRPFCCGRSRALGNPQCPAFMTSRIDPASATDAARRQVEDTGALSAAPAKAFASQHPATTSQLYRRAWGPTTPERVCM